MSLLDQLSAVKLKNSAANNEEKDDKKQKTFPSSSSSAPAEKLICETSADYHRLTEETYFETYYDSISHLTFPSEAFQLSREEIRALLLDNQRGEDEEEEEKEEDEGEAGVVGDVLMNEKEKEECLSRIAAKIDERMTQLDLVKSGKGAFIRLSIRSPKDASLRKEGFQAAFKNHLERKRKETKELLRVRPEVAAPTDLNVMLQAIHAANIDELKVRDGEEALQLLRLSKRIRGDLKKHAKDTCSLPLQVIVREFAAISPENEFRAFVSQRHLTALTQYNDAIYVPKLVANKEAVESQLRTFVEQKLIPTISMESYVVDLVIVEKETFVVEINPFAEFAGTCLFSWSKDRQLLTSASGFEFRLVEQTPKFPRANVNPHFLRIIDRVIEEEGKELTG